MQFFQKMSIVSKIRHLLQSTTEIIPNVYQLTIKASNVILIIEEKLTLIDTGLRGSSSQIVDFIHHLGHSPEEINLIILTHNHIDHMGGLAELKQLTSAKIAIHKNDIGERKYVPSANSRYKLTVTQLSSSIKSAFSVKLEDVDIQLDGGEILEPLGGLEVIHTPGHTPGSISLYSPKNKMLIAGDALRKRRKILYLPPGMASSDLKLAADSIKKLALLDTNILCLGHGLPLSNDVHIKMQDLLDRIKD
jgi:glyoxylase-like metal-dependent hydrolase (beta-lactamase superfamily II)